MRMNSLLIIGFYLVLIKHVIGERGLSFTNYTMDFFNNLNIKTCNKDTDCPDYSNGCYIPRSSDFGYCNIYMFCHQTSNCLKLSLGEFSYEYYYQWPYYKTESYDIHNLTMGSCNLNIKEKLNENKNNQVNIDKLGSIRNEKGEENDKWGIFEDCKYLNCNDSNCFSGICNETEDICAVNDAKPGYVCTLTNENNKYLVKCLLMNHEPCKYHSDCLSGICDTQAKICVTKNSELTFSESIVYFFKNNWILILVVFFLILLTISVIGRIRNTQLAKKEIKFAEMEY